MIDAPAVQPSPGQPILVTPRLALRPLSFADTTPLHVVFADAEVMRYVDYPASGEIIETMKRIELWMVPLPEWHATWSVRLAATEIIVGIVNFHHREVWNRRAEIGYILGRRHWGQGLMREAVGALIAHCFDTLGMNRLEATIDPENHAAIRLAARLGFRCEGATLRERLLVGGRFRDVALYGLLKRDWVGAAGRSAGSPAASPPGNEIIGDPTGAGLGPDLVSMPS